MTDVVRDGRFVVVLLLILVPSDPSCSLNFCLAQLVLPGSYKNAIHPVKSDELKADLLRLDCLQLPLV